MAMNSLHCLYHSKIYYIDHFLIINLTLGRVTVVSGVLCMLLLLLCGDIETNPGPTRYPCKLCRKPVAKTHCALCCEGCDQWVHILCAGIPKKKTEYERLCDDSNEDQWFCSICSGDTYQYEYESSEHRQTRLARKRQRTREETEEEREDRLASRQQRRREETEEEREDRLASRRQLRSNLESSVSKVQDKQEQWQHAKCSVCAEQWPVRKSNIDLDSYICLRCSGDKRSPKMFPAHNDMDPGSVPSCLGGMTQIEEMLTARACPIMTVYRKHGGQRGYQGHVLNLPQNIQQFLKKLPAPIASLSILIIKRVGAENTTAEFRVRRQKALSALLWLKHNNRFYHDIDIDQVTIASLPQDGIPTELQQIDTDRDEDSVSALPQGPPLDTQIMEKLKSVKPTRFYLCHRGFKEKRILSVNLLLAPTSLIGWPELGQRGINEFCTEGLATQVFPTLFPFGKGDPTTKGRHRLVTLSDAFKHLIHYCDKSPDGCDRWRFASHPRFPYWALNMKHRHQLLSQSSIFLKQNPTDAHLTIEQLRDMVGRLDSTNLISRIQRYASKLQGSKQYWHARYEDLKALFQQKGSPTLFWTVRCADNYWPQLHSLMPSSGSTHTSRVNSVISNPHLTDWYFHSRLSDFIDHWLRNGLNAEWYWYRYEYQARGSSHAHGCAKLKDDPGITKLVSIAALGWEEQLGKQALKDSTNAVPLNQHLILYGRHAEDSVTKYVNTLVTTVNNSIPDETWRRPDPHPCAQKLNEIENVEDDYEALVNYVQHHTQCNPSYCLKSTNSQGQTKSRFRYPIDCIPHTTLSFEELTTGKIRATIATARNGPWINPHNKQMLRHWRANVDLQITVDVTACSRYLSKYVAKSEPI